MDIKRIMLNLQGRASYVHDNALVAYWTKSDFHVKAAVRDVLDLMHGLNETTTEGSILHDLCLKYGIDPNKQTES